MPFLPLAYIGPGAGLSLISAIGGLIAVLGASTGFLVLLPLRAMFRRKRAVERAECDTANSGN